jgi:hypothetical protein
MAIVSAKTDPKGLDTSALPFAELPRAAHAPLRSLLSTVAASRRQAKEKIVLEPGAPVRHHSGHPARMRRIMRISPGKRHAQ